MPTVGIKTFIKEPIYKTKVDKTNILMLLLTILETLTKIKMFRGISNRKKNDRMN